MVPFAGAPTKKFIINFKSGGIMELRCTGGCIAFATSTAFEPFPVEGFETGFFSCGSIFWEIWDGSREIDEKFFVGASGARLSLCPDGKKAFWRNFNSLSRSRMAKSG